MTVTQGGPSVSAPVALRLLNSKWPSRSASSQGSMAVSPGQCVPCLLRLSGLGICADSVTGSSSCSPHTWHNPAPSGGQRDPPLRPPHAGAEPPRPRAASCPHCRLPRVSVPRPHLCVESAVYTHRVFPKMEFQKPLSSRGSLGDETHSDVHSHIHSGRPERSLFE